ncbi:MAG: hypothetical protein IEMM0003_0556 [bacterium]|nr:MAG: hypothetical protein IEMM0003_0556 [bacterium]
MILDAAFIFIFGLIVGSFLNVIIYRTPKHESIVAPASHCTVCGSTIKWYDNIPVISFLLLHGRCRKCGETISAVYPAVEIVTALIFLIFYLKFSLTLPLLKYILFAAFLIALSAIDFFSLYPAGFSCISLNYDRLILYIFFAPLYGMGAGLCRSGFTFSVYAGVNSRKIGWKRSIGIW